MRHRLANQVKTRLRLSVREVGGQAVLGRQDASPTPWLTERHGYDPTSRSRAVQGLAVTGLLSEAFQLAWADGCATGLRTRSRHVCDFRSASSPLSARSAAAYDSALAWCHGSRLLSLRSPFVSQVSGAVFNIADASEGFHGSCPDRVSSPVPALTLSRLSASFIWQTSG